MIALLTACLLAGATATTFTLWATGFGGVSAEAANRLTRLKSMEGAPQGSAGGGLSLRKRATVTFGGVNLVSANLVQQWTVQLERAGLALNAREYFILRATFGVVMVLIGLMTLPMPQLSVLGLPLGYFAVGFWLKRRIGSRTRKLEAQLVEMLQMLASGLRAGFGLIQALDSASEQLPNPLATEIRRTLRDTAMGASVEQALSALNQRVGSSDFDIVITATLIQRSVGGNLAEILDNVAHTMRERERIRGEIRTLTSQQRMTGYVIGGIPIGLGIIFMMISPEFTGKLFTDPLGRMMLGGAIGMEILGFAVIRKIVNIEV
ncbi:MAG: type II secretion system F family protein [Dehalococcoidia bacterium]|nr:type II secretion system F family protein [Dehalococcoidia bacterium]